MSDYLAIALIGAGSSYGRDPNKDAAVARCKKIVEQDWAFMFDLHGKTCTINVYDVTGHDDLFWDDRGVHPRTKPETCLPRLELVKVTLSVAARYRRKRA
jgi:hypothetical protein